MLLGILLACQVALAQEPNSKPAKDAEKAPVTIRVLIHAKAKLQVDDLHTKATGSERVFTTPPLTLGKTYAYTLRWTYPDGARKITRMAVVQYQPGRDKTIDLRPGSKDVLSSQIIYVPTDQEIVDRMLAMAKVKKDDLVYDLGCGDGRIVVTAAKKYGAKGVGIDIDPDRIKDSRANVKKSKVGKLVEIRQGDALQVADISRATVVMLYMLPEFQEKLAPILKRELKQGTRVVAHDYYLPGWEALETEEMPGEYWNHSLYLYRVGEGKKK